MSLFGLFSSDKSVKTAKSEKNSGIARTVGQDSPDGLSTLVAQTFAAPPSLTTERLTLCRITEEFAADMYEYSGDPDVTKYLTWSPHSGQKETERYIRILQKKYADGSFNDWGLVLKDSGKFIGTCGYTSFNYEENTAEVGYVLAKPYWGQALAPEAVKAVMRFGFEQFGLDGYTAKYMEGNDASGRVMQKCGMSLEGVYRHSMYIKGEFKNIVVYRVTREDFYRFCGEQS